MACHITSRHRKPHYRSNGDYTKKFCSFLHISYYKVKKVKEKHTDDELFSKKKYPLTGTTSLGAYFISSTSSHYDWGLKTIKPLGKMG
jgi:hypothetical protein